MYIYFIYLRMLYIHLNIARMHTGKQKTEWPLDRAMYIYIYTVYTHVCVYKLHMRSRTHACRRVGGGVTVVLSDGAYCSDQNDAIWELQGEYHTYIHTYIHACIHTWRVLFGTKWRYLGATRWISYIHTYIHTHIHTYIHTYMHMLGASSEQYVQTYNIYIRIYIYI